MTQESRRAGEQEKRERVRLEAAERFARGEKTDAIEKESRVTSRSVGRWRHAWQQGGVQALCSRGPVSVERLSARQWARLERELQRGPLAHGGQTMSSRAGRSSGSSC
jgi:putative transposase